MKITTVWAYIANKIFKNRHIWLLSFSCVTVTIVKATIMLNWSHQYMSKLWNIPPVFKTINYLAAIGMPFGYLAAGWLSDKFFCENRWKTNILFHFGMLVLLAAFWIIPTNIVFHYGIYLISGMGFITLGLQVLILVTAIELSHKKIRSTVAGLIMLLILITPMLSNISIGTITQVFGWNFLFATLCGCSILSAYAVYLCRSD